MTHCSWSGWRGAGRTIEPRRLQASLRGCNAKGAAQRGCSATGPTPRATGAQAVRRQAPLLLSLETPLRLSFQHDVDQPLLHVYLLLDRLSFDPLPDLGVGKRGVKYLLHGPVRRNKEFAPELAIDLNWNRQDIGFGECFLMRRPPMVHQHLRVSCTSPEFLSQMRREWREQLQQGFNCLPESLSPGALHVCLKLIQAIDEFHECRNRRIELKFAVDILRDLLDGAMGQAPQLPTRHFSR